jgi:hypothetical protein
MIVHQQAALLGHEDRITKLEDAVLALMSQVNHISGIPNDPHLDAELDKLRDRRTTQHGNSQ